MAKLEAKLDALAPWAPLILRVLLGMIFVLHGSQKLFGVFGGRGPAGHVTFFANIGINPAFFWGWIVIIVEFFGGAFLVFGFLTRIAAALLVINMTVAIFKVHFPVFFVWSKVPPGGFEFPMILWFIALSLVLSGPSFLSVDRLIGLEKEKD